MRYLKYTCEGCEVVLNLKSTKAKNNYVTSRISKVADMIFDEMGMRKDCVKRCICLGILLLMTGCSAGKSIEPGSNLQEKLLTEAEPQIETESLIESALQAAVPHNEDDEYYVQCLQNLNQGNSITYADEYYYFRS